MRTESSFMGLIKEFRQELKNFIQQEIQLVKTEISEKMSGLSKNVVMAAIGGCVAYTGLIIFVGSLGLLAAFLFQRLGLEPMLAGFVGFGIISLLVIGIGAMLLLKGVNALKAQSLAPEKTIETIYYLKGTQPPAKGESAHEQKKEEKEQRSSEQIEAEVMATEHQMAETFEEITERATLRHARRRANAEIHSHPYRWGFAAMATGVAGSFLLRRKLLHGKA